jgi:hypothetical protein
MKSSPVYINISNYNILHWLEYQSQFCIYMYLTLNTNTGTYIQSRRCLMYIQHINIQYTYIVGKYKIYLYEL